MHFLQTWILFKQNKTLKCLCYYRSILHLLSEKNQTFLILNIWDTEIINSGKRELIFFFTMIQYAYGLSRLNEYGNEFLLPTRLGSQTKLLKQVTQCYLSFRQPRVSLISGSSETAHLMMDQTSDPTWWAKQEAHFQSIWKEWVAHLFLILIITPNRVFSAIQSFSQMSRKSENNIHEPVAHTFWTKRRNRCLPFAWWQNERRGHSRGRDREREREIKIYKNICFWD